VLPDHTQVGPHAGAVPDQGYGRCFRRKVKMFVAHNASANGSSGFQAVQFIGYYPVFVPFDRQQDAVFSVPGDRIGPLNGIVFGVDIEQIARLKGCLFLWLQGKQIGLLPVYFDHLTAHEGKVGQLRNLHLQVLGDG